MSKKNKSKNGLNGGLREVKNAGYTATKKVKRDKSVNRRAGLHDKLNNSDGEVRVKSRKPLALKHVRRMRKVAAVFALGIVGVVAVFLFGFFAPTLDSQLDDLGNPTVCAEPPADGSKPTDYTIVENIGFLNYVLQSQPYWSSETHSNVQAMMGIEQGVDNYKQYYNGILISADCSFSGLSESMQYGEQFCQAFGVVLTRYSTSNKTEDLKNGMNAPWSTDPVDGSWTVAGYRENRGLTPLDFSVYILNEKTILNANDYSVVDNGDGTYSMTLELNVNTDNIETAADYYYRQQMWYNGNLNELPVISKTTLTYTFDSDWRVLELVVDDAYRAKAMGINSNCTSRSVTTFSYDEASAYNTFWEDYFKAEYERVKDELSDDSVVVKEEVPTAIGYLGSAFASVMTDGAVFKVDLSVDDFVLNGVVSVEMENSELSGLTAKLGDALIWLDGNTLFVNDGSAKYKLETDGLFSSDDEADLAGGFDIAELMNQMTAGEFTFNAETGIANLVSGVELFGLEINMEFEFLKTDGGVELNFLKAQIPLGGKVVNATLCFGDESDKLQIPEDTAGYTDILNDGVTLDVSLTIDGLALDGIARIIMQNGEFIGAYADLGDLTVYYDCPPNMLYLRAGDAKYKLDISALGTGDTDLSQILGILDINALLNNIVTDESSIGTSLSLFENALKAALSVSLDGGIKVSANIAYKNIEATLTASLTNKTVTLPDLSGYIDVLNSCIALDVQLNLYTGLADEDGNRDEVILNGQVALEINGGQLTEIRADFGGFAVYYEFEPNVIYIRVGSTKAKINLSEMDLSAIPLLSSFAGGGEVKIDLPAVVSDLLENFVATGKIISSNADMSVLSSVIPLWAELNVDGKIAVKAGLSLLGIDAVAQVKISDKTLEPLSAEEKEEYLDVLEEGKQMLESLLTSHISADVSGTVYSYVEDEEAGNYYGEKYVFTASLEYDEGENGFPLNFTTEEGLTVDSTMYLHVSLALTAVNPDDDSLFLDLKILDANPVSVTDGRTNGGYTADGALDIYLTVSKFAENAEPLRVYAPVDELMNLASMALATVNLNELKFNESEELTQAVDSIASLLDRVLIGKYLTASVQDKFASLGESLIPQILGVSLGDLLEELIGTASDEVHDTASAGFNLSAPYISSIITDESSLTIVLDSSTVYGKETSANGDITVIFERVLIDGKYCVGGIDITNIFFGENEVNKLNIGMSLDYGEVVRPDESSAFADYLNVVGLDTLVNGIVNSATHDKSLATDREKEVLGDNLPDYILNHYYYINGQISANLNILNIIEATVNLDLVAASVTIDEETNDVAFNIRIHYNALPVSAAKLADIIVISGECYVDLTIKNGMLFIQRTQLNYLKAKTGLVSAIVGLFGYDVNQADSTTPVSYETPVITHRVYDLENMESDIESVMDLVSYVLNLDEKISALINDEIKDADNSNFVKTDTKKLDYGALINYYFTSFVYSDDGNGNASWKVTLSKSFLTDMLGMEVAQDPEITFSAKYTVDSDGKKSYIVDNLTISNIAINFAKVGSNYISMTLNASLEYCNPQLVMKDGCTDVTKDCSVLWEEVFGCEVGEIAKTELWKEKLQTLGKTYLEVGTQLSVVGFEYISSDGTYVQLGKKQFAYYDTASNTVTGATVPVLPVKDGLQVVWDNPIIDSDGVIVYRAMYYQVTYTSDLPFDGKTSLTEVYTGSDNSLISAEADIGGVTLLGWVLADGNGYRFISSMDDIKAYVVENAGTALDITLCAVWIEDITVTITSSSYSWLLTLKAVGSYSGGGFASEKSLQIAEALGMTYSASVVLCSSSNGVTIGETWSGSFSGDNSFSLSHTAAKNTSYAGAQVTITYTVNGEKITEKVSQPSFKKT